MSPNLLDLIVRLENVATKLEGVIQKHDKQDARIRALEKFAWTLAGAVVGLGLKIFL